MLATSKADLEGCDTQHIVRLFKEVAQVPKDAKAVGGSVFLSFPSCDDDPTPNWQIPIVRSFTQKLDAQLPHFPYFLTGDVLIGQVQQYIRCLVPLNCTGKEFVECVQRKEQDVRRFCRTIADSPERTIEALAFAYPPQILSAVPGLRAKALHSMRPLLQAMREDKPTPELDPAQAAAVQADFLQRALVIAGLQRRDFPSDRAVLDALLRLADES
jgi:hypothetical protein